MVLAPTLSAGCSLVNLCYQEQFCTIVSLPVTPWSSCDRTHFTQQIQVISYLILKGLCHQIIIAWNWYWFNRHCMEMRRLIFKKFSSEPLIFKRHFKFLCWGSKIVSIFHLVSNLNRGCSKWVQIAVFASWNNSDFQCLFLSAVWLRAFSTIIALFASWKLLELLYIGFEHKLRIVVSSTSVQDLNRAAPATFRTQREQI